MSPAIDADGALAAMGWDDAWESEWSAASERGATAGLVPARLARCDRGVVTVWRSSGTPERASNTTAAKDTVAGDWVGFDPDQGRVGLVLPRRSRFERRAARGARRAQVMAANMDVVWVAQGLVPGVSARRLERELALAHQSGAEPLVVLTKADLVPEHDDQVAVAAHSAPGVPILVVSAVAGHGMEALRATLHGNGTAAIIGASGVGKSTLVNHLLGAERQVTAEVRDGDLKGRHTTTAAELIPLPDTGYLLDTPGVRALALWRAAEGVDLAFPEITDAPEACRFDDCSHRNEPGCAVLALIEAGEIDPARHRHWMELVDEVEALN